MYYTHILKELRTDHDLSQDELASKLGLQQAQYQRYESGTNELPVRYLIALCNYYGVSADYILGLPKGLEWPR